MAEYFCFDLTFRPFLDDDGGGGSGNVAFTQDVVDG